MTSREEDRKRAELEKKASALFLSAIHIIDRSLLSSLKLFGVLTVDLIDQNIALEKIKQSRALGWVFIRDNAVTEEAGQIAYNQNDIDAYAQEAIALIIARSIKIAQQASLAYQEQEINQDKVIENTLNARRKGRVEGYATDAVHGSVEIGKYAIVSFLAAGAAITKTWFSIIDDKTRPTHLQANGQQVSLLEYFLVGGFNLLYPRDRRAPIRETASCRCITVYSINWSK
ncbi:hypothetical protein [Neisseria sp. Ec49-e6-T10]|uniref:hypothetical protein n=1 Tax=Neisseria sp. Ec49-e6-T10 TaxID=3140744 RepID=UPI003EBFE5AF